jgi:hypothetical protein
LATWKRILVNKVDNSVLPGRASRPLEENLKYLIKRTSYLEFGFEENPNYLAENLGYLVATW